MSELKIQIYRVGDFKHHVPKSIDEAFKDEVEKAGKSYQSIDDYKVSSDRYEEACDNSVIENKIFHPQDEVWSEAILDVEVCKYEVSSPDEDPILVHCPLDFTDLFEHELNQADNYEFELKDSYFTTIREYRDCLTFNPYNDNYVPLEEPLAREFTQELIKRNIKLKENTTMTDTTEDKQVIENENKETPVVKDDPITKLNNQIAKQSEKLIDAKYVADKNKGNLEEEVKNITASFESQIKLFQNLITEEFLEGQDLLKDLGKDLPAEDIDNIYFVHSENPDINSKHSERKKEVVKFLKNRSKTSNEYKLALNFRISKYKTEVAKFIKSYINTHIRLVAQQNSETINKPVTEVRTKIDNSPQYKEEMDKVLRLKAKRASEKLERTRKLEKARAMKAVAKAGIIAVLDNCVSEARTKLIQQFDYAVVVTQSQLEQLSKKIEGFDPKSNVEHYQKLVKNVLEILETSSDFKIEPIGSNTDSNSEVNDEEVLSNAIQNGGLTPEMQQQFMKMMFNPKGGMPQTSNGKVTATV